MRNPLAIAGLSAGAVAVSVVIGCSSGEERVVDPALEDYFQSVAASFQANNDCDEVAGQENAVPSTASDETRLTAMTALMSDLVTCQEDHKLDGLNPPQGAQDAHDDFVRVEADLTTFFGELAEMATNAESGDTLVEINAWFREEDRPGGLPARGLDACLALQEIADENDIDEDLDCVD